MAGKGDRFAFKVKGIKDAPEALRDDYAEISGTRSPILSAVYAPPMDLLAEADKKYFGGYLLVVSNDLLTIGIEKEGIEPQLVEIPLDEIICLESGSVLLYSWFQIFFGKEECSEIKILYNTVGEHLFREIIFLLRRKLDRPAGSSLETIKEPQLPLKFRNEMLHWLLPGERIIDFAFQPEITEPFLWFFKKPVAPPLLAVITDLQFFIITEIKPVLRASLGGYSEIYVYCPFSRFAGGKIEATGATKDLEYFTLMLANGRARHSTRHTIRAGNAEEFKALCELIHEH